MPKYAKLIRHCANPNSGTLTLEWGIFMPYNVIRYKEKQMSTLHHAEILETIFEEVQEAFPYLDEDKQIEIANQRFQDMCQ